MFSLNLDDSDENIDTDESLLTQKPHFTLGDEFLNDDENSDASSMHTKRPCFSLGGNENTDTTNEDSEVHAIIPVETKRTRKRRKRTQRAHSRQLPPAPRCHQNCKTNCRTVEHYREDANDMTVVSACRTSNCACNISADLAPSRPGVLIVTADCCLLVMQIPLLQITWGGVLLLFIDF